MSLKEIWKEEGVVKGTAIGKAIGKAEGIAEGKAEGIAEGKVEGISEGIAKGRVANILELYTEHVLTAEQARTRLIKLERKGIAPQLLIEDALKQISAS